MNAAPARRGHAELRVTDAGVHAVLVGGNDEDLQTSEVLEDVATAIANLAASARLFGVLHPEPRHDSTGGYVLDCGASLLRIDVVDQRTTVAPE